MVWEGSMVTEDWRREYEKVILSRKYSAASTLISMCFASPSDTNAKMAFGAIVDFVTSMPIGEDKKNQDTRDGFLSDLDEIELALYGNPELQDVQNVLKKYNLIIGSERMGVKRVTRIQNLPELAKRMREVLLKAGDFATSAGLRIMLAKRKKFGMDKILDEENIKDLEL